MYTDGLGGRYQLHLQVNELAKQESSKNHEASKSGFLFGLHFNSEDRCNALFRNVHRILPDSMALQPEKFIVLLVLFMVFSCVQSVIYVALYLPIFRT
jgi:hypothetical protein